jgi:hypothetical protein
MSETMWIMVAVAVGVWVITVVSALVGAYLMFKGAKAVPGEGFLGRVPKGQVFSIPEAKDGDEFPEDEKQVLEKTEKFLKLFGAKPSGV